MAPMAPTQAESKMEANVVRLDVLHEFHFSKPAFMMVRNTPDVLQAFYDTIAPRYPVAPEHMSGGAATVLSEFFVRIGLFGNANALELRVDRMILRFPNILDEQGVKTVKDVTSLAHDALKKSMPEIQRAASRFALHSWLVIAGGTEAAAAILKANASPAMPIDPDALGAETAAYTVRLNLLNHSEKWDIQILSEPSALPQAHLFVLSDIWFRAGSKHSSLPEQITMVGGLMPRVLTSLGFQLSTNDESVRW